MFDIHTEAELIRPDERLDDLQRGQLRLLQKTAGFRFGMDAVLLADFAAIRPGDRVADFGTGTGVLPLLLCARGKGSTFDALELQPDMADMAARSMRLNGLEQRIRVHHARAQDAAALLGACTVDAIVCNPPYAPPGTSLHNPAQALSTARHQDAQGLGDWFRSAHRLLKGRGRIFLVYPAPRMLQLMQELEAAHLAPKHFRLVYPRADKPANLVLVEAQKDARPMLHPMPPLIVYEADGSPTPELRRIYQEEQPTAEATT